MNQDISYLTLADRKLAYQQRIACPENSQKAGILFLSGFASDMTGTKAAFLDEKCAAAGIGYTRFDYRGHGLSSDDFENGCIGDWADDALLILDRIAKGPQILVGSSMGGWIALLLMKARPQRIAGFIGIAAAPDFTTEMIEPTLTETQKRDLETKGKFYEDAALEGNCPPITRKLMEDGKKHLVLDKKIDFNGPVHLIQGQADKEVPWSFALKLAENIESENVKVTLVKDGDHRLSRPQDLEMIWHAVKNLVKEIK